VDRIVRWAPYAGAGLEQARVASRAGGTEAEGVVLGEAAGAPFALRYRLRLNPGWAAREVWLELVGEGRTLHLLHDERGGWKRMGGGPLPELDGCLDLDIGATPLTNTLPIRRLGLAAGESRVLRVAMVEVPSLRPIPVEQRYTCLDGGRLFRFEALGRGFAAEIVVDDDGLVADYPPLFKRVLG